MIELAPDLGTALFDQNRRPMFVFDRDSLAFLRVNPAMCERYGWTRDELLAMTLRDIRAPEDVPGLEHAVAVRRDAPGPLHVTSRHRTRDGAMLDVEVEMVRVHHQGRAATIATVFELPADGERERRFRLLVEMSGDGISVTGADRRVQYMSPAAERILGLKPGELIGKEGLALVTHPEDAANLRPTPPGETQVLVLRVRHSDGSWRWLESVSTNLTRDPAVRAHVSVLRDITARKEAEEALKRSEANFRAVIDCSPAMTFVHRAGTVLYANRSLADTFGFADPAELVGRSALDHVRPDDHAAARAQIARTAQGLQGRADLRLLARDGREIVVETQGVRVEFDGEPAHVVFCTDVSERRELYARMAVADRMVSVGTLAAGVAHEINNPLAYVMGNLELLARELPAVLDGKARLPAAELHAIVADARDGASRVSTIVRDLRALSRSDESSKGPIEIEPVLASCIKMVSNELRHRARLVQDVAPDLPPVEANASRLGQVFLNLLVNAAHAIPAGRADANSIRVRAFAEARDVVVELADTGVGIPPNVIGRIFDPFFTTKPIGQGTGLGLAISHEIVRSLGGSITVDSVLGAGATFRVVLPAAERRTATPDPGAPARITGPRLRVLLVDDEPGVGRSIQALLAPEVDVTHVTRARDALDRLAAGDRFDVVLCDLMMPQMSGIELFVELRAQHPALARRVVFLTGGAFTEQARDFLGRTEHPPLEKPFTEAALRAALARVTSPADPA